jgi:hypothetical protein
MKAIGVRHNESLRWQETIMPFPPILPFSAVTALFAAEEATEPFTQVPWYLAVVTGVVVVLFACAFLVFMVKVFPRGRRLGPGQNRPGAQEQGHHKKKYPGENWPLIDIDEPNKPGPL